MPSTHRLAAPLFSCLAAVAMLGAPRSAAALTGDDTTSPATSASLHDLAAPQGELDRAIAQYKAKRPMAASLMLTGLLRAGARPEERARILYYLGRSFRALEMPHSAEHHFLLVLKEGREDPHFSPALAQLVQLAKQTNDASALLRVVSTIPPSAYPRGARSELHYLAGVRHHNAGRLREAGEAFERVSPKSRHYARSEYYRGVISQQQGDARSAARSFREVIRADATHQQHGASDAETGALREMAILNTGRLHYGLARYEHAAKWYALVDNQSQVWPTALFEHAWADAMERNENDSLGKLLTVRSPFFRDDHFLPESQVLRALTYFSLCEYETVEDILGEFERRHQPMHAEMTSFVDRYSSPEGEQLADQAWRTYFGAQSTTETVLPSSLFAKVLRNRELASTVRQLRLIDEEQARIAKQKARWRDTVGPGLVATLEADRLRLERRAGLLFLREMARQSNKVADLLTQSELIRFEVVDALRVTFADRALHPVAAVVSHEDPIFATSPNFVFWPFNGEFWEDELGSYTYTEPGACRMDG
jgi:tetratricopeptide (TPR) repeat protein